MDDFLRAYPGPPLIYMEGGGGAFRSRGGKGEGNLCRGLVCVGLVCAVLLTGCQKQEGGAQQQGVLLRGQYQAMTGWQGSFQVSAHLGEQVYDFVLEGSWTQDGETVLTVAQPDWMAGITARMSEEESVLEYDGAGMTLGTLNGDGLSPIAAIPDMLDEVSQGYIAQCSWEQEGEQTLLQLLCRDPEEEPGEGTEYVMWFAPDTYALRLGEVRVAGTTVLTVKSDDFTMEMKDNESTDHADLDGDSSGPSGT